MIDIARWTLVFASLALTLVFAIGLTGWWLGSVGDGDPAWARILLAVTILGMYAISGYGFYLLFTEGVA